MKEHKENKGAIKYKIKINELSKGEITKLPVIHRPRAEQSEVQPELKF